MPRELPLNDSAGDPLATFWRTSDPDDATFEVKMIVRQDWIPIGPRHALPWQFHATWDDPRRPFVCQFHFLTETDGAVICTSLEVSARQERARGRTSKVTTRRDVTLAGIRGIRIGEFKRRATRLAIAEVRIEDSRPIVFHQALGDSVDASESLAGLEEKAHEPRRGKKLSDAHLRKVARVYRQAQERGEHPTKAVTKAFFTVRPNASRWVAEARSRGLLEPLPKPRPAKKRAKGGKTDGKKQRQ